VTDLECFFVQLVRNLAASDRSRLGKPLLLVDIRTSILPYRANRRALQLESSEDYELMVMRLCAGEGGFARTGPDEVGDEFRREVGSPNPDLTLVERQEKAVVHLDPKAVAKALQPKPDLAFAPQDHLFHPEDAQQLDPVPLDSPSAEPPRVDSEAGIAESALRCTRCGAGLPTGRVIKFCPQCGQSQVRTRCPQCKTELEPEWRHCVSCGLPVSGPIAPL
jgi:predicted RNA-binding Zn-ribbon protein involved in translation (DUF1610 family)